MLKNFIMQNWLTLVLVVLFLVLLIVLWAYGKKDFVKRVLYYMVCRAEQVFGSGTGEIKFNYVLSQFYSSMPLLVRLLFSLPIIEKYIELAVFKLKVELSQGMNLLSYTDKNLVCEAVDSPPSQPETAPIIKSDDAKATAASVPISDGASAPAEVVTAPQGPA